MNPKQFVDFLKYLQKMKCPSCGQAYKIEEVQFLGQIDGLLLLQMICGGCDLLVGMNLMLNKQSEKAEIALTDLKNEDYKKNLTTQISADEQIAFHKFLEQFEGDFKELAK